MKKGKGEVTIVVSAKNEAGGIVKVLKALAPYGDEIIVVDGHSTDGTRQKVRKLGIPIYLDHGLGKGDGMKVGVKKAKGDCIVFFDADGSHDEKDIPQMVKLLKNGKVDFVLASRRTGGSFDVSISFIGLIRSVGADFLTMLVNQRFRTNITDILFSFRAIKKDVFKNLKLNSDGFEIEQEMVVKSLRKGYKVAEIPSREKARGWGKSKLHTLTGIKFIFRLLRLLYLNSHEKTTEGRKKR